MTPSRCARAVSHATAYKSTPSGVRTQQSLKNRGLQPSTLSNLLCTGVACYAFDPDKRHWQGSCGRGPPCPRCASGARERRQRRDICEAQPIRAGSPSPKWESPEGRHSQSPNLCMLSCANDEAQRLSAKLRFVGRGPIGCCDDCSEKIRPSVRLAGPRLSACDLRVGCVAGRCDSHKANVVSTGDGGDDRSPCADPHGPCRAECREGLRGTGCGFHGVLHVDCSELLIGYCRVGRTAQTKSCRSVAKVYYGIPG